MKIASSLFGFALTNALLTSSAFAEVMDIKITNLTHGSYFTPLFAASHNKDNGYFHAGEMANDAIKMMAEGGSIDALVTQATSAGNPYLANPAEGLLAPGQTVMVENFDSGDAQYLSLVGMVLPSNDGFVGLDSWMIPSEPGEYTITVNAYDAGSEANDEIINGAGALGMPGIPANPGGNGGANATGVTTEETNTTIHIHRGVLGDTDPEGGVSDLDSRIHRWLNPVARITFTVKANP